MKLTAILLLAACLQVSANGNAQGINLAARNVSLQKVFRELQKQSGYDILYSTELVKKAGSVNIELRNVTLRQALDACLKDKPLSYTIVERTVVIKPKEKPVNIEVNAGSNLLPDVNVRGRVVNEEGIPLEGISIMVKGTTRGTSTNANGEFEFKTIDEQSILVFSGIMIEPFEVPLNGRSSLALTAKTKTVIGEAVVINKGYYTESRKLSTASVGTVTAREIERQPVSNALQAIQGRTPGILIRQQTGVPGGGFDVVIRGKNSLINGNDPLYIIDGVPYPSQAAVASNTTATNLAIGGGTPSALNYINPGDIEAIDILKDADATAIYGSRGANGVVLITTKKGRPGGMNVDANVYAGFGEVAHIGKLLNTEQYVAYRKEAIANEGVAISATDYDVNGTWDQSRYTNWPEVFFGGKANYTNAQLSLSGGNNLFRYLVSGNYYKETHIAPDDFGFRKGSMHLNLNTASTNQRFKVQLTTDYGSAFNHTPYTDLQGIGRALPVLPPTHNEAGDLLWLGNGASFTNPYSDFEVKSKIYTTNFVGSTIFTYQLIKSLELKLTAGYNRLATNDVQAMPTTYYNPSFNVTTGSSAFGYNTISTINLEPQVNFNHSFGSAGTVSAFVAYTSLNTKTDGFNIRGTGYTDNRLLENMAGAATITRSATANANYKYGAVFGRVNYNLKDKYVLNFTARRDGSSRFGPGKQFANFYAVGGAWVFSREKFFTGFQALNYAKLRGSYGTSGSDQVGDYKFWDLYTFTNFTNTYQGSQGLFPSGLFNPGLGWESNRKGEVALEFSLWNEMLSSTINYYNNRSSNQLVIIPLSYTTGFNGINGNLPATVENSGWEFLVRSNPVRKVGLNWVTSVNLTLPKNRLVDFPGLAASSYATRFTIGEPITSSKVYVYTGVNPQTGLYSFRSTVTGKDTSNPNFSTDRTAVRNTEPDFYGGFHNNFTLGNFELDFSLYFVKQIGKSNLFLNSIVPGYFLGSQYLNWPVEILENRWTKPGDIATIQRYASGSAALGAPQTAYAAAGSSTFAYVDASFIRMRSAYLAYVIPNNTLKTLRLKRAKVYLEGQNLFTITKYKGDDPENQGKSLAPLRVLTAGINIGF